jgi:hypothetical protein
MEIVVFDVTYLNFPFNVILKRLVLYQFMEVVHYRFLVLKILTPNCVIILHADHGAIGTTIEKLQELAAARSTTN